MNQLGIALAMISALLLGMGALAIGLESDLKTGISFIIVSIASALISLVMTREAKKGKHEQQ